jgi:Ohr subfamily peroxiredoxin
LRDVAQRGARSNTKVQWKSRRHALTMSLRHHATAMRILLPIIQRTSAMNTITAIKPAGKSTEKVVFTGKTHNTAGRDGGAQSADGFLDIKMSQPHPAAENLFGAAWSACYMGAIELVAAQRKVALPTPPAVDAEIDLNLADGSYFLRARMSVSLPGVDRAVAQDLIETAHTICPYSKAVHGNIEVTTTLQ